jgi:kynurenine formamidase
VIVATEDNFVSLTEFEDLFRRCSNWGRWGSDDQRGALNHITAERIAWAASLVRDGEVVSCARVLDVTPAIDNPAPAVHRMTELPNDDPGSGLRAAMDFLGAECHGEVHSHIDALCHIAYNGKLYNGWDASTVTESGGSVGDLGLLSSGIVSRGVLLDIAALRHQRWLSEGEVIGPEELGDAEATAGVEIGPGDVLLIRTGHALRREVEGPWDSASHKAGLHPRSMPWLKDREIAAVGFDGDGDAAPHACPGVVAPIHVLGINAMGLHFFDALSLEALAAECIVRRRFDFFFAALPLRARGATGCVINPVAIF